MKLYMLKACDTCRKAMKELQSAGHSITTTDVRDDGISQQDLERFLHAFGDDLLNKRSKTWRDLDEDQRALVPLALLQAHPLVMKRPVIDDGTLYLGWGNDVQAKLIG
ncbi:arsenate reductase family protein [Parasulfitobacter algicola]|uniref:Arsenate reductase n=1 Tax=Parasulfitobacter algicola TaxID=2614809 RepID=A0ABX2IR33_9RHOB|nr:ArsC/Spx/MgsR family protein [Sulfitobacter algicola]NSX54476.1 arsenate reductase [Sulfitobacter algicola]